MPGTLDPDFPDIPLGGWAGVIQEVSDRENPPNYLIEWNQHTLEQMHPVYRKRCQRDYLEIATMWLAETDLELDIGERAKVEQPTNLVSRPLSKHKQDDRIRIILGLTSDDPLPLVTEENLAKYQRHLATHLSFPFQADYRVQTGPFEETVFPVTVVGLLDADACDEEEGVLCEAILQDGTTTELLLASMEAKVNHHNRQLIYDYAHWFCNWERDFKIRFTQELAGGKEAPVRPVGLLTTLIETLTVGGLYGAILGSTIACLDGAFIAVKTGAALLGLVGCVVGARYRANPQQRTEIGLAFGFLRLSAW